MKLELTTKNAENAKLGIQGFKRLHSTIYEYREMIAALGTTDPAFARRLDEIAKATY